MAREFEAESGFPNLNAGEIVARLQALRVHSPALQVTSELIRLDETVAVVRSAIVLQDGASASSLGSAQVSGPNAVEIAEVRALGRALSLLGLVALDGETSQPVTVPVTAPEPAPTPVEPPQFERQAEPEVAVEIQAPDAVEAVAAEVEVEDDPELEDYSWTAFWKWARSLGYQDKVAVEALIGESITSLNPLQVRNMLRAKTGSG